MSLAKPKNASNNHPGFNISCSGVTHTGKVRERNEDAMLLLEDENLWLVADGMGGHQSGDFASTTITRNLGLFKQQKNLEDSILLIEENLMNSNAIIREKSSKMGKNATIGSTVVCAYIWQKFLFVFWAGDSRLYRFREERLDRLTDDHSYVEELVRLGKIESKAAEHHPAANVVLKAVGIDDELYLDFDYVEIEDGDIFIICSDGLYKDLEVNDIASLIGDNKNDMAVLTQTLLSHSLTAGGTDNISIVTITANRRN